MDYLSSFQEMLSLRGVTDHTKISYSTYIRSYLDYLSSHNITPEQASWQQIREFIVWLQTTRSLADRTINCVISQLRFFQLYILHKPWDPYELPFRKFDMYLPYVPDRETVCRFISTIENLKFKAIITLMYSAGLRCGEVCHLRCRDISQSRMNIHITHGKNRSDRYADLSVNALKILNEYWLQCGRPQDWLFPVQSRKGEGLVPIRSGSISAFIHAHEEELGWEHRITAHTFRHAYATHLYEAGADLLTIKELLGHRSINSTTIYVHLADRTLRRFPNPFDQMEGIVHE